MKNNLLIERARILRTKGRSFGEIAKELNIGKSTARFWTGKIKLKPRDKERLYTKRIEILSRGLNSSKERRRREIDEIVTSAEKEVDNVVGDGAYKLIGAMLYWAEGNKTKQFALTNSDPLLVKFFIDWASKVFAVTPKNFKAYLNIHSEQNDSQIKKFWAELTGIPIENFGKSFVKPAGKNFKKNRLYYGTIKVRLICGGDTLQRLFAWIRVFLRGYVKEVDFIETKWNKLKV